MIFRRARKRAAALSSLMAQTRDTMVCFDFRRPIDPKESQEVINAKLRDCYIVDASQSFARFFGYKDREKIIGVSMRDVMGGEVPDWFVSYGQEVEDRNFDNLERLIQIPVGDTTRTMRIHMQNIFEDGLLISQWITIRDVSEEEAAKAAAAENERLKLLAFEAVGLKTFKLDIDPIQNNTSHGDMEVDNKQLPDWWRFVHGDDQPRLEEEFKKFYSGEDEQMHTQFRSRTDSLEERWYESWAVATERTEKSTPTGILGVVMDRTEAKQMEMKMIAAQRLESLGLLAGGIAHDFNNLLVSVTGALDIARQRYPDASSLLQTIDDAAGQLTGLCDQMLTYAGKGVLDLTALNVSAIVSEFRELLSLSVKKNVALKLMIEDDCWIQGDSGQLRQLLMNLVRNAADAIPDKGGEIEIQVYKAHERHQPVTGYQFGNAMEERNYVAIRVTDTGAGIEASQIEHLFDPFYSTKFTGRGLGLAVVHGITVGHGGLISVESNVNQGTTMTVLVPAIQEPSIKAPDDEVVAQADLSGCVLVVDDDASVRMMAGMILRELGLDAEFAEDGESGLALYYRNPERYDVVLMDVTMPGIDGISATNELLEKHPTANVIICSGYSDLTLPEELADKVSFMKKPFRLSVVQSYINKLVRV